MTYDRKRCPVSVDHTVDQLTGKCLTCKRERRDEPEEEKEEGD